MARKLKPTQILLEFADASDAEYFTRRMVATGNTYESYVLESLMLDEGLPCDGNFLRGEEFDFESDCPNCDHYSECCLDDRVDDCEVD